ncbi:uncharacterized protein PSFLO_01444 [Pseudozyma flocculosa]|uniref:BZIP domain-containing protein n=2 Tax=Pseudozyma flocculosa TaxID=84751 RepID=A0A5C3EUF7_9BASI|nr:uncharacterized protein PSFLO_01444 [Pseudozyma flocculosa]
MSHLWNEPAERSHFSPNAHAYAQSAGLPMQYHVGSPNLGNPGRPSIQQQFQFVVKPQQQQQQQQQQHQHHHAHDVSDNYQYRTADAGLEASGIIGSTSTLDKSGSALGSQHPGWAFEHAAKLSHPPAASGTSTLDAFGSGSHVAPSSQTPGALSGPLGGLHHDGNTALVDASSNSFISDSSVMANTTSYPLSQAMAGVPIPISQPVPSAALGAPVSVAPLPSRRSVDVGMDRAPLGSTSFGSGGPEMTASEPTFAGSSASPTSSNGRLGSSPESQGLPRNSMFGEPALQVSGPALANVDAWMASSINAAPSVTSVSSTDMAMPHGRSSSVHYASSSQAAAPALTRQQQQLKHQQQQQQQQQQTFKTSVERRERNKASQRESRKRRQDRLEMLEAENAALRKALASAKKDKAGKGLSSKFSGAIFLDVIEPHLEDSSAEQGFNELIGHRFPEQKSEAQEVFNELDVYDPREAEGEAAQTSDVAISHSAYGEAAEIPAETDNQVAKSSGPVRNGRGAQPQRKNVWELGISHHESSKSFTSLVVVPELVLYKVCRLYFSLVLPFTTSLKSGIVNLRAARAAPFLLGGPDELPRFKGDPLDEAKPELVLPQNLMPTENQLRIGFHPVEIAVIPFPSMRDKLLTIIEAFHKLEGIEDVPDGARITEEERAYSPASTHPEVYAGKMQQRTAIISDMSTWTPEDELDPKNAVVIPDRNRVYRYGFTEKPKGSVKMGRPAQRFLDDFFVEVVRSLRIWTPAGDVFDQEGFELRESFFEKYPSLVDEKILRATNRWRRARGEAPIRL